MAKNPKIAFIMPVESISRKMTIRKETCANLQSKTKTKYKWFGAAVLNTPNKAGEGARNIFIVRKNSRTSAYTADETAAKIRFTAVAALVKARSKDLSHISTDQVNFLAQKDQPGGVKSMKAYLWKIMGEQYDSEQS